jgi:flagellar basal-body rod protein FlgF
MENALYVGLSRQTALRQQMNLVANNIANVNTPGFRADKMLFEEYIQTPKPTNEDLSMVLDYGQYKDVAPGAVRETGNALDVALEGPAFFMVETAAGTQYSRAGNFALNNNRELVNAAGNPVLDNGQGRMVIPPNVREITITTDGQITTDQGAVGQIGMVEFANVQNLRPTGAGYFVTVDNEQAVPAQQTKMRQNMLEGSNVQAVLEMTDLIEISRQYQSATKFMQNEHDRQRDTIQKLTEMR